MWADIWSELWRFSFYGSIGFVLGAAWCEVQTRNKRQDLINDAYLRRFEKNHEGSKGISEADIRKP